MISERIVVESIRHINSLDMLGKEKLVDEIFTNQPNMLGTVIVLSKLNVPMAKIDIILFILLVLYEAFVKRSGLSIPLITEDLIEKMHKNNTAMLKYVDKETDGYNIIGQSMLKSPHKFIMAFVVGHLNDQGFSLKSVENEYCVRAAKVIMDCFIQAASKPAR
jgi:hypothetical protein